MPKFETGVLRRSKSKVNDKKRVKIGHSDFGDVFDIFRKFREHFISNFKRGVLTNGREKRFEEFEFSYFCRSLAPDLFAFVGQIKQFYQIDRIFSPGGFSNVKFVSSF